MRFKIGFWVLCILLMCPLYSQAAAQTPTDTPLDTLLARYSVNRELTDWEAFILGINGMKIKTPLFATPYFKRVEKEVRDKNGEYRLVTDYARIALAFKSHGKDISDIAGYDFTDKITSFPTMRNQGLNAYSWALIALYGQDADKTQPLIKSILTYQLPSGGFAASVVSVDANSTPPKGDVDLTAMAVTALSPYRTDETVQTAVEQAVAYLSAAQEEDGTYTANGVRNAESVSQVIIALCAAGVEADDTRFVKNGCTLADILDTFRLTDGMYAHVRENGAKADPIATRQAALALSAYRQAARYDAQIEAERAASGIRRGIFECGGGRS